ncbi:MAG: cyclic nucleotide-binding domain-containing protein, partial [Deltaproteobacteria bacterium]|nr:cyclic nucleotide-binding domain-containing protein [Deltaproteobacteria bacterium]
MDVKDLSEFIRKIPLFSIYTDEELDDLMKAAELKSVGAGEVLFEQGDPGDKFYIVYSGKIRIVQKNEKQKEVNLGVRTRGDHFGETALIRVGTRNATARAAEDTILIAISRESFDSFLFARPELREYFDKFIKNTSIHQFLKTCTNLSEVAPKDLQELARQLKPEFFNTGDVVFRQGAEPDKFYLIETGKLKVVRWEYNKQETINFLREGDFFGEKALIEETTRYADIVCLTDCHLFSLSREAFDTLVHKSPKLRKVIEDRIKSYLTDKPPIPYTEIIKQELAALKEIRVEQEVPEEEKISPKERRKYSKKFSSFYRRHISFPFIMQHDEMTCGTTCIMMIAKYYGKTFSSSRLRDLAHVDLSGSSMANLASAAEQLGFSSRGLKLDYEALMSVPLPCIVHWQGYHYIVVYKIDKKHVWVADPAIGLRKYKKEYFLENTTGITLTLEPTIEFESQAEDQSSLKRFLEFVLPYRFILFEIFIASLLLNIFGLATPIFTQNIVDKVLIHQNISMLNIMLIGMLIVLIFRVLTMIVRQYLIIHTSMKIDLRMLVLFYKHLLSLPLGYFKVRKIGDFITRFGENLKIRNFLTNTALTLVLDSILIIVYLSLMIYYNVQLTVLVLVLIPVFIIITLLFTPILKRLNID